MSEQPEALRLADAISAALRPEASLPPADWARAAAELRRLHELNVDKTEIISALSAEVEQLRAAARAALSAMRDTHYWLTATGNDHVYDDSMVLMNAADALSIALGGKDE